MLVKGSQVWSEPRAISVLSSTFFLNGACLFKMVSKALLKNNQASSTDGMRSISFQDTRARSIRNHLSVPFDINNNNTSHFIYNGFSLKNYLKVLQ